MARLPVGDLAEPTRLFQDYRPRLLGMLRRRIDPVLLARIDAEDVLHDTYVEAQRRWPEFARSGTTPFAWLYRIAKDCLIEAWRHETRAMRDVRKGLPWPDESSVQFGLTLVGALTTL